MALPTLVPLKTMQSPSLSLQVKDRQTDPDVTKMCLLGPRCACLVWPRTLTFDLSPPLPPDPCSSTWLSTSRPSRAGAHMLLSSKS